MFNIEPETLFRIVDIAAVVANGLLGGAVARALRFDMVGFLLLAVVCSMGGGMIRDILLNVGLPIALTDGWYWVGAITSAALAYVLDLSSNWATRALVVVDFLGMGCWAATGTIKSLTLGLHWLPAIALGVTTAVGGGVIRDIMVNRIPAIFGGNSLYGHGSVRGRRRNGNLFQDAGTPSCGDRYVCAHLHGVGYCGAVARLATADAHHAEGSAPAPAGCIPPRP